MASPAAREAAIKRDREKSVKYMAITASLLSDTDDRLSRVERMLMLICDKLEIEIEQPIELTEEQKRDAFADLHAAAANWSGDDDNLPDEQPVAVVDPVVAEQQVVKADEPNPYNDSQPVGQG